MTFTGLPSKNTSFGRKTATITCALSSTSQYSEQQDYEVFYDRDATNHPACTKCHSCPNWFYYWNQICGDKDALFESTITDYGRFKPSHHSNIYIGIIAKGLNNVTQHNGIDCFAETVKHESTHKLHYNQTHGNNAMNDEDEDWLADEYELSGDYDLNGSWDTEDINYDGILDIEEDIGLTILRCQYSTKQESVELYGVRDGEITAENGIFNGSSKYHAFSFCPSLKNVDDDEYTCRQTEHTWDSGSMNRSDWGCPGMNHATVDKWDD